ncbi:hypothetical protein AGMMS49940_16560 [Spirochaetia bacterium]|nr:hypothetical protein AGMMS49940_16560 [Spirochaetia bacterium]
MAKKHFLITQFNILLSVLVLFPLSSPSAQTKYALVIGNSAYSSITKLNNPVNDAMDMKTVLEGLGFQVDLVTNGSRVQMEEAVNRLQNRLSMSKNAYGFFFYAGHGVQSQGENFLLPVDANIPNERYLRDRAVNVQVVLDELNDSGNELNVIVLDACRDNPFSWKRSGSRGLAVVSSPPVGSIIVYATSAGSTAADGEGRNGLFTTHLLNNLKTPGLEVKDIFNRTGSDVRRASNSFQVPAIYSQFFETAYLGSVPAAALVTTAAVVMAGSAAPGSITVSSTIAGTILVDGKDTGVRIKAGGTGAIQNVGGSVEVAVRGDDGQIIQAAQMVSVLQEQVVSPSNSAPPHRELSDLVTPQFADPPPLRQAPVPRTTTHPGKTMYVTAKTIEIKKTTAIFADTLGTLSNGDPVSVLEENGKWVKISSTKLPGISGWVAAASLRE